MNSLNVYDIGSAPVESRVALEEVTKRSGHISNLWGTMANSPVMLNSYLAMNREWEKSSLTAKEREIVLLSISVVNQCPYCIAGHCTGLRQLNVGSEIIRQVLYNEAIQDARIGALSALTKEVVANRGFVSETSREAFINAGYPEAVILDILLGVAMKTMANYLDHIFPIPIDKEFESEYLKVIEEDHE